MTDTTRNRSAILAKFLRCAVRDLEDNSIPNPSEANADAACNTALQSVVAVAEELELVARAPDPAEATRG